MYAFGFAHKKSATMTEVVFTYEGDHAVYRATITAKGVVRANRQAIETTDDVMEKALQAAQDVEEQYDQTITNPNSVALGMVEMPDGADEAARVRAFYSAYQAGVIAIDTAGYLGRVGERLRRSAAPSESVGPLTVTEPLLTPTGEPYQPRLVSGHHDVAVLWKAREAGMNMG